MYLLLIFVRTYLLPGSGTKEVKFLSEKSNVQHTGQWIFKIGWKNMGTLNVESGDSYVHRNSEISRFFIPDQCKYQVPVLTVAEQEIDFQILKTEKDLRLNLSCAVNFVLC